MEMIEMGMLTKSEPDPPQLCPVCQLPYTFDKTISSAYVSPHTKKKAYDSDCHFFTCGNCAAFSYSSEKDHEIHSLEKNHLLYILSNFPDLYISIYHQYVRQEMSFRFQYGMLDTKLNDQIYQDWSILLEAFHEFHSPKQLPKEH